MNKLHSKRYFQVLLGVLSWLFVIILMILIFFGFIPWDRIKEIGPHGLFLINIISGAGLFFGGPAQAMTFALAESGNPILIGIISGIGNSIGEAYGYYLGSTGRWMFSKYLRDKVTSTKDGIWFKRLKDNHFTVLMGLAILPNPLFDPLSIICGSSKFPFFKYFLPVFLGKVVRFILIAIAGYFVLNNWIFIDVSGSP